MPLERILMKYFNIDANIVALSGIAIAIGVMVDVGIVFTENIIRHIEMPENEGARGKKLLQVRKNNIICKLNFINLTFYFIWHKKLVKQPLKKIKQILQMGLFIFNQLLTIQLLQLQT